MRVTTRPETKLRIPAAHKLFEKHSSRLSSAVLSYVHCVTYFVFGVHMVVRNINLKAKYATQGSLGWAQFNINTVYVARDCEATPSTAVLCLNQRLFDDLAVRH